MGDDGAAMPPLPLQFVMSAANVRDLPDSPAEVAVVGRSNVGKSSLVNAVSGRNSLANVSKTPGRTRLLNCFALAGGATVVDCPGYGYAEASKSMRASFKTMIERYLREREPLEMLLVLVDGEIGPTRLDLELLDWVRAEEIPHTIVATKHDKVKSSQRAKRKKEVAAACHLQPDDIVWVSAVKGTGIERLRGLMALWLSATG
jgi:GTP-binding protein